MCLAFRRGLFRGMCKSRIKPHIARNEWSYWYIVTMSHTLNLFIITPKLSDWPNSLVKSVLEKMVFTQKHSTIQIRVPHTWM